MNKSYTTSIPEVPNFEFTVEESENYSLDFTERIIFFKKKDKVYATKVLKRLHTKMFGSIDVSTLSDREVILIAIFGVKAAAAAEEEEEEKKELELMKKKKKRIGGNDKCMKITQRVK